LEGKMKKLFSFLFIALLAVNVFAVQVLVVKDGADQQVMNYYMDGLKKAKIESVVFDTQVDKNLPKFETLNKYDVVMWICGDSFKTLSTKEKDELDRFLNDKSNDKKNKSLFIEGERVLYDSAFIDYKSFFRQNFDVEFVRSMSIDKMNIKTNWSNPITWGMRENFTVNSFRDFDVMKLDSFNDEDALFRLETIDHNGQDNNGYDSHNNGEILTIGVAKDEYKRRLALLSFSPEARDIWEIRTSNFKDNLIKWLTDVYNKVLNRLIASVPTKATAKNGSFESDVMSAVNYIKNAIDHQSYDEFDMLVNMKSKMSPAVYQNIMSELHQIYKNNVDWQRDPMLINRLK